MKDSDFTIRHLHILRQDETSELLLARQLENQALYYFALYLDLLLLLVMGPSQVDYLGESGASL